MRRVVLAGNVILGLFLLESRLGDGQEECTFEAVLLAMLTDWGFSLLNNIASNLARAAGVTSTLRLCSLFQFSEVTRLGRHFIVRGPIHAGVLGPTCGTLALVARLRR